MPLPPRDWNSLLDDRNRILWDEIKVFDVNDSLSWGMAPGEQYTYNRKRRNPCCPREPAGDFDIHLLKRKHNIVNVISLLTSEGPERYYQNCNFSSILWLPVHDRRPPSLRQLSLAIASIEASRVNNEKCYVYCRYGIGRSPTMVIGYLMKSLGYTYSSAYSLITDIRPIIGGSGVHTITPEQIDFLKSL